MKAIIRYPGSKWSIAEWIIAHFPAEYEKMIYVEPFAGSGALYRHEMDDEQHVQLLKIITRSRAKIVLSGYQNDLYARYLQSWETDSTMSQTTSAVMAEETIWMNYQPPHEQISMKKLMGV